MDRNNMQDHPAMGMSMPVAEGALTGVGNHKATGTVHILDAKGKRRLHFTPDFSIEKASDVYVTLTNGPAPVEGASIAIARLTRFTGEQTFEVPANADLGKYSHVVLWSRKSGISLGQAKLPAAGAGMMDQKGTMMDKDEGAR